MAASTIKVEGMRNLLRTLERSEADASLFLRAGLQEIAEGVALGVRMRYRPYSGMGADGVRAKVTRPGNAVVVQTLRKSRNPMRHRGNFGGLMMRKAFLPALDAGQAGAQAKLDELLVKLEEDWI